MKQILGILGGMGPLATAHLFKRIIELTKVESDQEHIHVIIDSDAQIPDRTAFIEEGGDNPLDKMIQSAKRLQIAGASVIIMPCNTAHLFLDEVKQHVDVLFINMLEVVVDEIKNNVVYQKGLAFFVTEGTKQANLYSQFFDALEIPYYQVNRKEQKMISSIIYQIKENGVTKDVIDAFKTLQIEMIIKGVKHIILGCTELSLLSEHIIAPLIAIDPLDLLAKEAIKRVGGVVKE